MLVHFHQLTMTDDGLRLTFFDHEPIELLAWDGLRLRKELQPREGALHERHRLEQEQLYKKAGSRQPDASTDLHIG